MQRAQRQPQLRGPHQPRTCARNYLASPPLVVAYALAGRIDIDFAKEPIGQGKDGKDVFLKDIWPSPDEVDQDRGGALSADMFQRSTPTCSTATRAGARCQVPEGNRFAWDPASTYVRKPTFFDDIELEPAPLTDITGARVLLALGDSVTTDHISPAGNIAKDSAAASYLVEHGVQPADFNSVRRAPRQPRGHDARHVRQRALAQRRSSRGKEGSVTRLPAGRRADVSIYDASVKYQAEGIPLVVLAGKEYGSGSSRDWAAKGTFMLGIRAVIAESYERIHRINLIGMGVLPLQFDAVRAGRASALTGEETYDIDGHRRRSRAGQEAHRYARPRPAVRRRPSRSLARIDTVVELDYYQHGGILQYVLRGLLKA